jgi:chitinase
MKKILFLFFFLGCFTQAWSQYQTSEARTWDRFPPEAQERGFGVNKSQLLQMDNDPALEEVFLFAADNGHYPYFDLFKVYYVIVDYYTKELKYKSEILISTKRELVLEDRNNDGIYELYRSYFRDGKFSVDANGNNLSVRWLYDRVEWNGKKITNK